MNGTSEPNTVKSMTSKKYPAAMSAMTRRCSGEIFASSKAWPTKPSMVLWPGAALCAGAPIAAVVTVVI